MRHRGHQDDRDGLVDGENARQHGGPGLARQPNVEQGHVDPARADDLEGRRAVRGLEHLELVLEDDAQGLADARLIVDDQDDRPRRVRRRGRGRASALRLGDGEDDVLVAALAAALQIDGHGIARLDGGHDARNASTLDTGWRLTSRIASPGRIPAAAPELPGGHVGDEHAGAGR